jgi:hypothetical protein
MPSLGNKSRRNHKQRYVRFIKTDGDFLSIRFSHAVGLLRLDFFGGLQAAKPFETAGKANPFRAEFGPTSPPPFWPHAPKITARFQSPVTSNYLTCLPGT